MKIVHVYARNLKIFNDALEGTGCRVNGSQSLDYMFKSLSNYNARDVMGLIVFRQHLTVKTLDLIHAFDDLFVFNPLPVIVACDDATELVAERKLVVKNSPLFVVNSIDGTISDLDLQRMFTTLSVVSGTMYDLSAFDQNNRTTVTGDTVERKDLRGELAQEVMRDLAMLGGEMS